MAKIMDKIIKPDNLKKTMNQMAEFFLKLAPQKGASSWLNALSHKK